MKKWMKIMLVSIPVFFTGLLSAQQRFPKPEFETGYVQPSPTIPGPRGMEMEYLDVFVLFLVLSVASWLVIKSRSRRGILWLSIFSLLYFGFYRSGCVCSVGAVQNVALTLFNPGYAIPFSVLLFFLLPLIFALFFGRTFCAAACPLGAIQDLLVVKPISAPRWANKLLGFIPYLYLGIAVLYASTATDFFICRYDPFVGIFRMDAPFQMIVLGVSFLIIGLFFARPYCRVLCPYGVLLNWMSRFSKWHISITPAECVQCKLCSSSCPFDAIEKPTKKGVEIDSAKNLKRFIVYALLLPLLIVGGGFIGAKSHIFLSKAHPDVYLAELLIARPELKEDPGNLDVQTFYSSGKPLRQLVEEATQIRQKFYAGGMVLGGFIGLVLGMFLLNQVIFRKRMDYEPDKGNCFSCGRCMDYCPVGRKMIK